LGALDRQSAAPFGLASCRQVTLVVIFFDISDGIERDVGILGGDLFFGL